MDTKKIRLDYQVILNIIEPEKKVLDLGCGNGYLMFLLAQERNAKVQGIELDEKAIYRCVEKGLSVFHSDIDSGLSEYPDKSFDYVILNQSLQQVKKIEFVLREAMRVGKQVIVGFPNFANLKARWMLFFGGKAPISKSLPFRWYDSPNVRFLSINDFRNYCLQKGIRIIKNYNLGKKKPVKFWPNLLALNAIFVIENGGVKE
ncbi:MAG: methionine biosynthesis protein MetW [Candidatus Omnitrophica bacterium]|nr:methionine biosynthesis protein MetW [Candidatus Omnitrophota bacterium]